MLNQKNAFQFHSVFSERAATQMAWMAWWRL